MRFLCWTQSQNDFRLRVRRDRIASIRHLSAAYKTVPASGCEQLLGVFTAPGFITFLLDPSNFLKLRPKCTTLPWIPFWYGNICPVLASMGGGKFEGCFEWCPWDGGDIQYGYPFQVTEKNKDELLVCGLSDLGYGLRAEDHPIIFTRDVKTGPLKTWRDNRDWVESHGSLMCWCIGQ